MSTDRGRKYGSAFTGRCPSRAWAERGVPKQELGNEDKREWGVDTLWGSGEAAGKGDPAGRPYGVGSLAPEAQNLKPRTQNQHLAGGDARPTMAGGAQARRLCHQYSPCPPYARPTGFSLIPNP
jgi:hypothetical protein